jgi:hypothetical protein
MTRPKQSSDTASRMEEPEKETRVALVSTPVVPSNTYDTSALSFELSLLRYHYTSKGAELRTCTTALLPYPVS